MEVKTIDRKKQIVDAATKSFSLFGYKATTMDQVAKLANVGKGTIYTFFSNKEELFDEIAFSLMDEMKGRAEKAISPTVTFSENVHNALFSMLEYRKEHKLTIKLYQEAREMGTPAVSDALQKLEQMVVEFLSERISRAIESCGTIGVLHALANIPDSLKVAAISENSWLDKFYNTCPTSMSSIEKAEVLENDDEIATKHDAATQDSQNQTSRGQLEDKVETHFVALVNVNGKVYELDGRKEKPVCHGDTKEETFLKDAASVVQKFMNRDPGEMRFTILAFAPTQN